MEFDAAEARKHITIEYVDKDYSKYSVFPVIISYLLDILHLDKRLTGILKIKSENYSFSGTEYLLFLFTIIFLGIEHIYKADDLLAEETQLAKILGFHKGIFPSSDSVYRLLREVDHWSVKRLDKMNLTLLTEKKARLEKKRWLVMDIDQTKKLTEGKTIEEAKPCYSPKKKGMLGLRLSASIVEGLLFSQKLEPGNVGNADAFEELFTDTLQKLDSMSNPIRSRRVRLKKIILRIDGGYFSQKTFSIIEQARKLRLVEFVMRVHSGLPLIEKAKKQAKKQQGKERWENIFENTKVLRLPQQQVIKDWDQPYTVLIIREKQKRIISKHKRISHKTVTIEYPLVTTVSGWKTKRIVKFYKKRQSIEDIFKDFNQSFEATNLPSHTFWGNALYFQMVSIASNSAFFFERRFIEQTLSEHYDRNPARQMGTPRRRDRNMVTGYQN